MSLNKSDSKQELWTKRIDSWRNSDLSRKEWCSRNQVALSTFGYWLKKLDTDAPVPRKTDDNDLIFAQLPSEADVHRLSGIGAPISVFSGNIRIEIAADCPASLIFSLMGALNAHA